MGRIAAKSVGHGFPYFADAFEGCETLEGIQLSAMIAGVDKVVEVCRQLRIVFVMVPVDGDLAHRLVHPFDLTIGPWELDFGEPVLDPVFVAAPVKHVGHAGVSWDVSVSR